jgi:hypothetical protein
LIGWETVSFSVKLFQIQSVVAANGDGTVLCTVLLGSTADDQMISAIDSSVICVVF